MTGFGTWLWSWIVTLWTAYLIFRDKQRVDKVEVDPNAKCPSCGHRKGKIRWEPEIRWKDPETGKERKGLIIHTCEIDGAIWIEKSIVAPEHWRFEIAQEPEGIQAPFMGPPSADAARARSFPKQ